MATVSKGREFVSGETVTPAKLNTLVDSATVSGIVNADIDASAAIALSKLATGALPTAITVASENIVDANVTPAKLSQPYTLATAQASTSGTAINFTDIPSWAKRITVMLSGVSFNSTAHLLIQIGSGSFATSGYGSWSSFLLGSTGATGVVFDGSGFVVYLGAAANSIIGTVRLSLLGSNVWVAEGVGVYNNNGAHMLTAGNIALSGTLDRVRITRSDASSTFDAGAINISYEG